VSDVSQGPGWWQASDLKWYPPEQRPGWWQASDLNWYPPEQHPDYRAPSPQPAQPAPVGKHTFGWWLGLGAIACVALVIAAVVIAAVGSNSSSKSASPVVPATKARYKVGDTAPTADILVTVFGFENPQPPPDELSKAPPGQHLVSVDVQVTNPTKHQTTFSSLVGFDLLDAQNLEYREKLTTVDPGPPDGQFAAGQSMRGFVVFAVPNGTTGLKLRVQGSFTAAGAVFALTPARTKRRERP